MKYRFLLISLAALAVSCSIEEVKSPELEDPNAPVFYATIDEQPDADTKVYADSQLRVLWNEDDRVTIFNKNTYNQQYRFTGEDGDNAGAFKVVPSDDLIMGGDIDKIYAVYPYRESTKITYDGIITTAIPSEQTYKENSFGIGSNTMTAMADGNMLKFKNVGGYLSLKFYGEGVSVSSIKLKSNNGELIAGECKVDMSSGLPESSMVTSNATDEITLTCETPVELGATAEEAVQFIFVLSPVTMTGGFTVTVTTPDGGVFEKSSVKERVIGRSAITPLGAMEVVPEYAQPNNVIYYTSSDGEIITPRITIDANNTFGANILSNEYINGRGVITFDGDVTSIGQLAFFLYSKLTSISLPNSVTSIGPLAFHSCRGLTDITIPESVTSIERSAFAYCAFTNISIPDSVSSIGDVVFSGCTSMLSFNGKYATSDGLFLIAQGRLIAAAGAALSGVATIPDDVTSIGANAFEKCSSLTGVIIPESVESIGFGAFTDCKSLTSIMIPEGVTSVGEEIFHGCTSLMSFTGKYATADGLFLVNQGSIIAAALGSINSSVTFPENVTTIERSVFSQCSGLTNISIPEGVTSIGTAAFSDCPNLTTVLIPESITSIGHNAFSRCQSLSSVTVLSVIPPPPPSTPLSTGADMFEYTNDCPIYVPAESVDAYKEAWSNYADRIQAIPNNIVFSDPEVKRICVENWDTDGNGELSYEEAAAVTDIGNFFSNNSLITSFDELKHFTGLTSIGDEFQGGFYNCCNLAIVTLPNTLTNIGHYAFGYCQSLVSLYIPSAVASIPTSGYWNVIQSSSCFVGCKSLSSIIISPDNMVYDSRDDCNAIIETATNKLILGCKNTIIPNTVEIIGWSALGGDPYNTYDFPDSIVIPDSVKEIETYAFSYRTNLVSVVLPEGLTKIGGSTFEGCTSLSSVMCFAENPPVGSGMFNKTNDCPIYVPAGSIDAYKEAWSDYADRIQAIQE